MPEDTRLPLASPDPAADLVVQLRAAAPQVLREGEVEFDKTMPQAASCRR